MATGKGVMIRNTWKACHIVPGTFPKRVVSGECASPHGVTSWRPYRRFSSSGQITLFWRAAMALYRDRLAAAGASEVSRTFRTGNDHRRV